MHQRGPEQRAAPGKMLGGAVVPFHLQFARGVFGEHRDVGMVEFTLVPGAPHDLEGLDGIVSARVPRGRENHRCVGIHGMLLC